MHSSRLAWERTRGRSMYPKTKAFKTISLCRQLLRPKSSTDSRWNLGVWRRGNFQFNVVGEPLIPPTRLDTCRISCLWGAQAPCSITRRVGLRSPVIRWRIRNRMQQLCKGKEVWSMYLTRRQTVPFCRINSCHWKLNLASVQEIQAFKSSRHSRTKQLLLRLTLRQQVTYLMRQSKVTQICLR